MLNTDAPIHSTQDFAFKFEHLKPGYAYGLERTRAVRSFRLGFKKYFGWPGLIHMLS